MKNERGFTLVEMLVVLLIISILILVTIPNVTRYSTMIDDKGCEAYIAMVQGQAETYKIENGDYPTLEELKGENYMDVEVIECPNKSEIEIVEGKVSEKGKVSTNE